jgi:hypothetical protein
VSPRSSSPRLRLRSAATRLVIVAVAVLAIFTTSSALPAPARATYSSPWTTVYYATVPIGRVMIYADYGLVYGYSDRFVGGVTQIYLTRENADGSYTSVPMPVKQCASRQGGGACDTDGCSAAGTIRWRVRQLPLV